MNKETDISADEALQRLKDGNARFLAGAARPSAPPLETLARLTEGQHPFATILACSDSRVPPEWIFEAGLGELFVVRVAGNVLSAEVAGSIQYASAHLQTPLLVVLGHEGCGAIQAALAAKYRGFHERSRIPLLVDAIVPALDGLDSGLHGEELLSRAVETNVRWTQRAILDSPEGRARRAEGRVNCVGAIYEIETGCAVSQPSRMRAIVDAASGESRTAHAAAPQNDWAGT